MHIANQITGTWALAGFHIEDLDGHKREWGNAAQGLLIYAPTGHMSVSINKAVENDPEQNESQNLFDSILFYSGTYSVEGNTIKHKVTQASNPERIGKEMIRFAEYNDDVVILVTPKESFGRAILTWRRV